MMLPVGTTLQMGKYRVTRYLASGGFGNTYVIENVSFGKHFVMKEFFMRGISIREADSTTVTITAPSNTQMFKSQQEKFRKEARRLFDLHGTNLVRVHDLFEENGTSYYVMDMIDGKSLSDILKMQGHPFSESEVWSILNQLLSALDEIHRHNIWHLDLKPSNILMDKNKNVVLIDFGASKQMGAQGEYSTTTHSMCYTPGYAPLEQIDQNIKKIGPWTDIYALGATLYCLLTGEKPPINSELNEENAFSFPLGVSSKMQTLVKWMMRPACSGRPQSVEDIRYYLSKNEQDNSVLSVKPINPGGQVGEGNNNWGCWIFGILGGLFVAIVSAVFVFVILWKGGLGLFGNRVDGAEVVDTIAVFPVDTAYVDSAYYDEPNYESPAPAAAAPRSSSRYDDVEVIDTYVDDYAIADSLAY